MKDALDDYQVGKRFGYRQRPSRRTRRDLGEVPAQMAWRDSASGAREPADIAQVGCLMKARGYRSFANCVSRWKEWHVASGYCWVAQRALEAAQGSRSD